MSEQLINSACKLTTSSTDSNNGQLCRSAVDEEFRKNRELGEATGCWRGGVLVEDDVGSVRKALAARDKET